MPEPQPAAPSSPLDLATLNTLLRNTLDALPQHKQLTPQDLAESRQAALHLVAALAPRDPAEAALAGRCVAAHHALMEAFRCAAVPDLPATLMLRFQGRAIALSRVMTATLRELEQRQQRPARRLAPALPQPAAQPAAAPPAPRTAAAPLVAPAPQPVVTSRRVAATLPAAQPTTATRPAAPNTTASPVVNKNPLHRENGLWFAPRPRQPNPALRCDAVRPPAPARPATAPLPLALPRAA